ncbi:MAG: S8 family serine peptidase [Acidimicrobiia bacterium]
MAFVAVLATAACVSAFTPAIAFGGAVPDPDIAPLAVAGPLDAAGSPPEGVVPGSLLTRPLPGREAELRALVSSLGAKAGDNLPGGFLAVSVEPARSTWLEARLRTSPLVAEVDFDRLRRLSQIPNDPVYSESQSPYLEGVRLPQAWDVTTGADSLVIAIVDSGVDRNHPDLAGRLLPGKDFVDGDADPQDLNGHGTLMAGIAAATTSNAEGIAGVAWQAKILPVRVLDKDGLGSDSQVAEGIAWAAGQGAAVINLSFGGPASSGVLEASIREALGRGVVVVAAAGNQGSPSLSYPASLPGVVAVSAIGSGEGIASFSNWGWWIDVAAPGVDVVGPWLGGSYAMGSGTSHASALVAGVAVLARAADPTAGPAQIGDRLRGGARDVGPVGIDPFYGSGIVDALSAVGGELPAPEPVGLPPGGDADGTFDRARPLAEPVRATISPEGDVDWYSLDVTDPAEIAISIDPPSAKTEWTEIDPVLSVYSPEGSLIGEADDAGEGKKESLRVSADGPGVYRVEVRNANGATSPDAYVLRAEHGPPGSASSPGSKLWLADHLPADLDGEVPTNAVPRLRFVRPLDPTSVSSAVQLLDARTGARIDAAVDYDLTSWVTLRPRAALTPAGAYLVLVSGELTDSKGSKMRENLSFRFVVGASSDQQPPDTRLSSTPPRQSGGATASFAFEADERGVSFECALDDAGFTSCTSPVTYRGLSAGAHRFLGRGSDAAGNVDPSPAEWAFTVGGALSTPSSGKDVSESSGYWMLAGDGQVFAFGGAEHRGDLRGGNAVDLEPSPLGDGYWVIDEAGRVRTYGNVRALGGLEPGGLAPGEVATSLSAVPDGNGYWIFTSVGRAVPFGTAGSFGDLSASSLNGPVLDSVATSSGRGYWLVGSDGGVFAFGDARFLGSMGGKRINAPVRSLVPTPSGAGYWLVASDGGVFAFGDAQFLGSMGGEPLNRPVVGMVAFGRGYLMAASDGGVFNFSDRPFHGSLGSSPPVHPIVALAAYLLSE